jgi:hypothetical protein
MLPLFAGSPRRYWAVATRETLMGHMAADSINLQASRLRYYYLGFQFIQRRSLCKKSGSLVLRRGKLYSFFKCIFFTALPGVIPTTAPFLDSYRHPHTTIC